MSRLLGLSALLLWLLPLSADAHDLWVLPPAPCAIDAPCTVRVTQGMTFPEGEGPAPNTDNIEARVRGPKGTSAALTAAKPDKDAARYTVPSKQAGLHIVTMDTVAKSIALKAAAFNHYLVSDGMPHVYRARHESGTLDADAVEQYQKFVKALVVVGDAEGARTDKSWARPTGQTLEIVPLDAPVDPRLGRTLRVRVLFRGRPLPEAHVGWSHPERGDRPVGTVRTDVRGVAAIPITQAGLTSLRLTHMEHRTDAKPEWRSFWTTLTFRVPKG